MPLGFSVIYQLSGKLSFGRAELGITRGLLTQSSRTQKEDCPYSHVDVDEALGALRSHTPKIRSP